MTFHIILHNNLFDNKQQTMNVLTPIIFEVCKAEKYQEDPLYTLFHHKINTLSVL